ncbi:BTAD domain-containing putative transcriptional regulator [Paenibacillus sp. YPG26]|uniref:BTAD domain-containing putative transcriptional regulator n=1 Tax=Paenibacillus sp. YPG26 TaxID=2878915 RepID=UPI00204127E8|nr:BTAD domain-containing putative transcriptional regulator [Paenibacillus sp. YPG26]USB33394.1 response regulator [Paenibacillus sp. YPG26]
MRAMIVDDEALAGRRLCRILQESGEIEGCHTFLNPYEAYEYAHNNKVDIAFLDITMPEISGMELSELLQRLDEDLEVVFVTEYDHYAVQAFERGALDYLLKPVTSERVAKTLDKFHKRKGTHPAKQGLAIRLFDGLKVYGNGNQADREVLKLRSPKTEELFAFLVCQGTVSRDEVIDTFWDGLEPEKAWKNLNSTLYYIRKAMNAAGDGNRFHADRTQIRIERSGLCCDLYEFEALVSQVRLGPKEYGAELFRKAASLYTGPLLKGKGYEWSIGKARQLELQYIEVLEQAAKFHLEQHQPREALYYFNEIVKTEPLREDISCEVIKIYLQLGRLSEAVRHYYDLEMMLRQELDVSPGPRLKRLFGKAKSYLALE